MHTQSGRYFYKEHGSYPGYFDFIQLLAPGWYTSSCVSIILCGGIHPHHGYIPQSNNAAPTTVQEAYFRDFLPLPKVGDSLEDKVNHPHLFKGVVKSVTYNWISGQMAIFTDRMQFAGSILQFTKEYAVDQTPQPGPASNPTPLVAGQPAPVRGIYGSFKVKEDFKNEKIEEVPNKCACTCDSFILARSGHDPNCPYILSKGK